MDIRFVKERMILYLPELLNSTFTPGGSKKLYSALNRQKTFDQYEQKNIREMLLLRM